MGQRGTFSQAIEYIVTIHFGLLLKDLEILEDAFIDRDLVVESDTILTQEIKYNDIGRLQSDVLELERTAADGISLVVTFFIPGTKCKFVD